MPIGCPVPGVLFYWPNWSIDRGIGRKKVDAMFLHKMQQRSVVTIVFPCTGFLDKITFANHIIYVFINNGLYICFGTFPC